MKLLNVVLWPIGSREKEKPEGAEEHDSGHDLEVGWAAHNRRTSYLIYTATIISHAYYLYRLCSISARLSPGEPPCKLSHLRWHSVRVSFPGEYLYRGVVKISNMHIPSYVCSSHRHVLSSSLIGA